MLHSHVSNNIQGLKKLTHLILEYNVAAASIHPFSAAYPGSGFDNFTMSLAYCLFFGGCSGCSV